MWYAGNPHGTMTGLYGGEVQRGVRAAQHHEMAVLWGGAGQCGRAAGQGSKAARQHGQVGQQGRGSAGTRGSRVVWWSGGASQHGEAGGAARWRDHAGQHSGAGGPHGVVGPCDGAGGPHRLEGLSREPSCSSWPRGRQECWGPWHREGAWGCISKLRRSVKNVCKLSMCH